MGLADWWLRVTKPFADWMIDHAKHNPYISYDEFKELKKQYDAIYNSKHEQKNS